ncbi:MBL fold metallo-hydrolase [Streptomyces sp. PKU-EA00015]|uniref:MBL fold metallo-hydrolase n=1 Tax=Streptomyces sp. PKU-EA00015 TaxID=2748326 RepID=UPI00159FDA05|nr:MBL fold metallo-hydrolase [Streptomyces sp. PKU-EA00015]NWF24783.1 MBL fold metallo-hydrolase [Streptomyces sp. PKU-EA00015]
MAIHRIGHEISVLGDHLPVPGIGYLTVNAFVLHAAEPVVVDTGLGLPDRTFLDMVGSVVDPEDVRWIWLTHPDRDHTGGLFALLAAAPRARLVTTYLAVGIMSTERPLPLDRVFLLNPGQSLDVGDRVLHAFRPPLFDNPATVGFYDDKSAACFSSDCFGAPIASADLAGGATAGDIKDDELRAGQLLWATVDSPWIHCVDPEKYAASVRPLREMEPEAVLSTHLPPALGLAQQMIDNISAAPEADAFVGPDQQALEQLLAGFEPGGAPR